MNQIPTAESLRDLAAKFRARDSFVGRSGEELAAMALDRWADELSRSATAKDGAG